MGKTSLFIICNHQKLFLFLVFLYIKVAKFHGQVALRLVHMLVPDLTSQNRWSKCPRRPAKTSAPPSLRTWPCMKLEAWADGMEVCGKDWTRRLPAGDPGLYGENGCNTRDFMVQANPHTGMGSECNQSLLGGGMESILPASRHRAATLWDPGSWFA